MQYEVHTIFAPMKIIASLASIIGCLSFVPVSHASLLADIGGETEIGSDGKGGTFASQFLFYNEEHWNGLARYFWVNHAVARGEFAIGPTFKRGKSTTKFSVGATTASQVITIFNAFTRFTGRNNFYIADAKHSTDSKPSTLYQKVFVGLDKAGAWHLKAESLTIRRQNASLRLGIEYRHKTSEKSHLAINPFYDPKIKSFGAMVDYRFF